MTVRITSLGAHQAGEVLTLQRAAYVTEAQRYADLSLPPLMQSLAEVTAELGSPEVMALGAWEGTRLVGAVRLRIDGGDAHLGRLVVAPDRQGQGIGTALLVECERVLPEAVHRIRLFTGHRSEPTLRLYERHGYVRERQVPASTHDLVHLVKVL